MDQNNIVDMCDADTASPQWNSSELRAGLGNGLLLFGQQASANS